MAQPAKLPGVALGSSWLLYLERGAAVLFGLLLVILVLVRGVIEGTAPNTISKDSVGWDQEAAGAASKSAKTIQKQIDGIEDDIAAIGVALDALSTGKTFAVVPQGAGPDQALAAGLALKDALASWATLTRAGTRVNVVAEG